MVGGWAPTIILYKGYKMKTFIAEFKATSYFKSIIADHQVFAIWIAGSTCMQCDDAESDYDIVILTLDGEIIDASQSLYLTYNGKRLHWYYRPIESLFVDHHKDVKHWLCGTQLRLIDDSFIIYINPEYKHIYDKLMMHKTSISDYSFFKFFETQSKYVNNILKVNYVEDYKYAKFLYHLCWYSYRTHEQPVDYQLLKKVKRFNFVTVSTAENMMIVDLLRQLSLFIANNPICNISKIKEDILNVL